MKSISDADHLMMHLYGYKLKRYILWYHDLRQKFVHVTFTTDKKHEDGFEISKQ